MIGWAKPTPVISRNFAKIRRDENLVTLAGPASNLLLAVIATLIVLLVVIHVVPGRARNRELHRCNGMLLPQASIPRCRPSCCWASRRLQINLALFFFNLLPIPPLDGSQLLRKCLPYNAVQTYDRIPFWVSWMLMIFVGGYIMRLLLVPASAMVGFVLTR